MNFLASGILLLQPPSQSSCLWSDAFPVHHSVTAKILAPCPPMLNRNTETELGGNRKMMLILCQVREEHSRLVPEEFCPHHGESEGIIQTGACSLGYVIKNKAVRVLDFSGGSVVKNSPANAGYAGDISSISGSGRSLEEEMATQSSILAWEIPWTEKLGGLQPMGSQRIRHN